MHELRQVRGEVSGEDYSLIDTIDNMPAIGFNRPVAGMKFILVSLGAGQFAGQFPSAWFL